MPFFLPVCRCSHASSDERATRQGQYVRPMNSLIENSARLGNAPPTSPARTALAVQAPKALPWRLTACSVFALAFCLTASGCGSLFNEGAVAGAGVGGAVLASKVTRNATVASGIGLGVLAGAEVGAKYVEKNTHRDQQDGIAAAAGPLAPGEVAQWNSHHLIKLEPDQHGRVTVSRAISAAALDCKEIIFSVDSVQKKEPVSAFYVATICRDGQQWRWASAEPATERWGSLQ